MEIDKNYFINKTIEALKLSPDDKRLSPSGFGFDYSDYSEQKCILFVGLNPAGDENTVQGEKTNVGKTYFYSFEDKDINPLGHGYNKYFLPIYRFANNVTGNKAKWPWCLKKWEEIEKTIDQDDALEPHKRSIKNLYDESKVQRPFVIYVADLFYYHDTNSKAVIELFEKNCNEDSRPSICEEILKMHIDLLKKHNKEILFVYVNNAKASKWLSKNRDITYAEIYNVPVFFGGMLSGQRALDTYSKKRLENEIVKFLNK